MNRAPSAAMRMSHSSARWNDAADRPALHRHDDRRLDVEHLEDAAVTTRHELVVRQLDVAAPIAPTSRPDENDLPSPRQITARTLELEVATSRESVPVCS